MANDRATTGKENKTVVALEPLREIMSFAKEKRAEIIPQHLFLNFFPQAEKTVPLNAYYNTKAMHFKSIAD